MVSVAGTNWEMETQGVASSGSHGRPGKSGSLMDNDHEGALLPGADPRAGAFSRRPRFFLEASSDGGCHRVTEKEAKQLLLCALGVR